MKAGSVIKISVDYYRLLYQDQGTLRPEDRGLWRALKVEWDGDHWGIHDDDDYLITDDRAVVAREVGWSLRREEVNDATL